MARLHPGGRRVRDWSLQTLGAGALLAALDILFFFTGCDQPPPRTAALPPAATAAPRAPAPTPAPEAERSPWELDVPAPAGFDRAASAGQTLALLQALIAQDTQNPPGNELRVARELAARLAGVAGVTVTVLEDAGEGRANLVARLAAGQPRERPVLVLAHMDTVNVQPERWETPPLQPTLKDGYLYGRGAIDDKGMLAAATVALIALAPRRAELTRDVILLATAAEEGGPDVGVQLVLEQHRELLGDAEFALNEGGRIRIVEGAIAALNLQTTEKLAYNVLVTSEGPSGHASVPDPANALAALARAVARVSNWRAPLRLNETTRAFLGGLQPVDPDPRRRQDLADLLAGDPDRDPLAKAAGERLSDDRLLNSILRTGQSLTLIHGGIRNNVIPSTGTATFNVRALPDDDITEIVAAMAAVGGEPGVRFELEGPVHVAPPASGTGTALYRALERAGAEMAPHALVLPYMSTGATDGAALRAAGIPTYGILPFPLAIEDELRMHGDNERVPVAALGWGAEYLYRTLSAVSSPGP